MKKLCICLFILACCQCLLYAQAQTNFPPLNPYQVDTLPLPTQNFLFGFNPSRTIFHALQGGFSIDPEIKYRFKEVVFSAAAGVSKYQSLKKDIKDYRIEGMHYKVGIEYLFNQNHFTRYRPRTGFGIGVYYLRAVANERGTMHLPTSFGNYDLPFHRANLVVNGIEFGLNSWIGWGKFVQVMITPRFTYSDAPPIKSFLAPPMQLDIQYMTGIGLKFISTNVEQAWISLGIECKVLFNLWKK